MSIDLRHLRSFVTVASAGSISGAAELLHIAQPALSLQIKSIEEELGVGLFDRTPKGVRLTESGMRFLEHSTHLIRQFDMACDDVRTSIASPRGVVVIGLSQSIAKQLVLPLVQRTLANWPKVRLSITELSTGYIPSNILAGHIDLGLVFQSDANPALRFEHLINEELVVVAEPGRFRPTGRGHAAALPHVSRSDLLRMPLVMPAKAHGLRTLVDRYLKTEKQQPQIVAEVNTIPQLIELAAAGVGCAVLSHASISSELLQGQVSAARIHGMRMERPVLMVSNTGRPFSAATAVVYQTITSLIRELVNEGKWPAKLPSS